MFDLFIEQSSTNVDLICGVDEAGRGPLAGAVYAAAVILDQDKPIANLRDSKKLSEKLRNQLFTEIIENSVAYSIATATVIEIDQLNILQATLLAMQRAILGLKIIPSRVLIDGNQAPKINLPLQTIIGGDDKEKSISAASILAKVSRDNEMSKLDALYPEYGFAKHKGYGTKDHLAAIAKYGVLDIHRKTFSPIKSYIQERSHEYALSRASI